jgi:probable HAF family extracellular repeat protein
MIHLLNGRNGRNSRDHRGNRVRERRSLIEIGALVAALLAGLRVSAGSVQYTVTDLGNPTGTGMDPEAINVSGQVVGNYEQSQNSNTVAFIWDSVHGLQTIDSSLSSKANGINSAGTVVGWDSNEGSFEWTSQGGLNYFENFSGETNAAWGINNSGTICGTAYPNTNEGYTYSQSAGFTALGFLGTGTADTGMAINNLGQVAGVALAGNVEAGLWTPGSGWKDLGQISSGGTVSGINDSTQVVGSMAVNNFNGEAPYEWTASTGLKPLATFNGEGDNAANGINNNGVIVGYSYFGGVGSENYDHAVMWTGGQLVDLNSVIGPNSGWVLTTATAINDGGEIVGSGYLDGEPSGFLLTPMVPEPGTIGLLVGGLVVVGKRSRGSLKV